MHDSWAVLRSKSLRRASPFGLIHTPACQEILSDGSLGPRGSKRSGALQGFLFLVLFWSSRVVGGHS